jgi:hypothetical protein
MYIIIIVLIIRLSSDARKNLLRAYDNEIKKLEIPIKNVEIDIILKRSTAITLVSTLMPGAKKPTICSENKNKSNVVDSEISTISVNIVLRPDQEDFLLLSFL